MQIVLYFWTELRCRGWEDRMHGVHPSLDSEHRQRILRQRAIAQLRCWDVQHRWSDLSGVLGRAARAVCLRPEHDVQRLWTRELRIDAEADGMRSVRREHGDWDHLQRLRLQ